MKATQIKPHSLYWATFNRFEIRLPGQCVTDCSHSGQCDQEVAHWVPLIKKQVEKDNFSNKPTAEKIREELREFGAWTSEDLQDDDQNWHRLVWCASCNIAEEEKPSCAQPTYNLQSLYTYDPIKACKMALRKTKNVRESDRLEKINELLGLHGTEGIRGKWQNGKWCDVVACYCNTGDTYAPTVIQVRGEYSFNKSNFRVQSIGDFVEKNTKKLGIL